MSGGARPGLAAAAALAALLLLAAGCGGGGGDEAPPDPVDPAALVAAAADRMEGVRGFHFRLEHERGATVIVRGIRMERAEGDVDGPERLRARLGGSIGPLGLEFGVVVLPGESWIQNPLTERWEREDISIASLFDPQAGIAALMRAAESPALAGSEEVGGVRTWRVESAYDSGDLAIFPSVEPGHRVEVAAWIGADDPLVHRVEARGPIADGEDRDIVRRLELSRFGQDVDIAPPR